MKHTVTCTGCSFSDEASALRLALDIVDAHEGETGHVAEITSDTRVRCVDCEYEVLKPSADDGRSAARTHKDQTGHVVEIVDGDDAVAEVLTHNRVQCFDCLYEEAVEGSQAAQAQADDHEAETGHDVTIIHEA